MSEVKKKVADRELVAINGIIKLLSELQEPAVRRVLSFVNDRFGGLATKAPLDLREQVAREGISLLDSNNA